MAKTLNEFRANTARKAIHSKYKTHPARIQPEDVTDILTDIRHLCDVKKWDFGDLDRVAQGHYVEESKQAKP